MTAAPTGDDILGASNAVEIIEAILPAQSRSFELGLKLGLSPHTLTSIQSTHAEPRQRLLYVILEFLKQVNPRPTWRVIINALKSPLIDFPRLAETIEAAHFPDSTSTRDVVEPDAVQYTCKILFLIILFVKVFNLQFLLCLHPIQPKQHPALVYYNT